MPRADVEKRLAAAGIPVFEKALPPDTKGMSYRIDGDMCIVLNRGLTPRERRVTLWHEYFHLKLFNGSPFSFHTTYSEKLKGDKIEAAVHRATARQLVPTGKLRRMIEKGFWVNEIADLLEVTEEVILDAIEFQLRRRGRFS